MGEHQPRTDRGAIERLFEQLATTYLDEGRRGGDEAAAALLDAPRRAFEPAGSPGAPTRLIEAACAQPGALPLAGVVQACADLLRWTHWEGEGLSGAVSANLYTTELLGPDGHVRNETVRVGLLLSDAHTDYPVSSHSGEETYLVISGVAEWTVDDGPYRRRVPGALVHHPAWSPHGRRTASEVFLGAWRWSGDLDLDSFKVDDPGA